MGRVAALSVLAVGAFAAPAGAKTICVGRAPCAGTLQQALSAAAALPGDDTVQLGPGIFDGPFRVGGGTRPRRRAGQTKLTAPASGLAVLKLAVPGSKASGLQIDKKGSSYGVSLEAATLEDARITGDYYQSGGVAATGASSIGRTEVDLADGIGIEFLGGGRRRRDSSVRAHWASWSTSRTARRWPVGCGARPVRPRRSAMGRCGSRTA